MSGTTLDQDTQQLAAALEASIRPATQPVGIKVARKGEEIPGKAKRPKKDFGNTIAACQGLSMARTIGWTLVLGKEDHACHLASVFAGHIGPERFRDGYVADLYQDDAQVAKEMEATYPVHPQGEVEALWLAPLNRCQFAPDLVAVYGMPAQVLALIHAANYGKGTGITSASSGRGGCAAWIAGAIQSGECTYVVPGSGERIFAGTQDHEMSFLIPRSKFASMAVGLSSMRKKGAYRYPVPNLGLMNEPKMPPKYYQLDPTEPLA
jgi:uncharacterized protein (DUF169 family)